MNQIRIVVICAASQYPAKVNDALGEALVANGYNENNSTFKVQLDAVVEHSTKKKEEPAPEVDPDAVREKITKIYAHYVTLEIHELGAHLGDPRD